MKANLTLPLVSLALACCLGSGASTQNLQLNRNPGTFALERPSGAVQTTVKPQLTPAPGEEEVLTIVDSPYFLQVNVTSQIVTVLTLDKHGEYTVPAKYMICSTGEGGATPLGLYRTQASYRWRHMLADTPMYAQYATRITGNYLFHSVNFTATQSDCLIVKNYNDLGFPKSGGCVRLQVEDAKWVFENVPQGTPVLIYEGPQQPTLRVQLFPTLLPKDAKWEPSDPAEGNPNHRWLRNYVMNTPYPGVTPAPLHATFSPNATPVPKANMFEGDEDPENPQEPIETPVPQETPKETAPASEEESAETV